MPPYKTVLRLQTISQRAVGDLVITACLKFEKKYGGYENETCKKQIDVLQKYVMSNIGLLIDNVFTSIQDVRSQKRGVSLPMLYAALIRSDVTTLKISRSCGHAIRFNTSYFPTSDLLNKKSFVNFFRTQTEFWIDTLSRFRCLVVLDICRLELTSGTAVYQNVFKTCKGTLKTVCFTPWITSEQFADVLNSLESCKELVNLKIYWNEDNVDTPTEELLWGINKLFESLTKLRCFEISGIESLLLKYRASNVPYFRSPSLLRLPLDHGIIDVGQIETLLTNCPNLKELEFSSVRIMCFFTDFAADGEKLFNALSRKELSYTTLWLPVHPRMRLEELWTMKGPLLQTLKLFPFQTLTFNTMPYSQFVAIGQLCPNLEVFEVQAYGNFKYYRYPPRCGGPRYPTKMYSRLKSLFLHNCQHHNGNPEEGFWDPGILPLILKNANDLVHIRICNIMPHIFDTTLAQLRNKKNSTHNLATLYLLGPELKFGCAQALIRFALNSCPKLTWMTMNSAFDTETVSFFRSFQNMIKSENIDFRLTVKNVANQEQIL